MKINRVALKAVYVFLLSTPIQNSRVKAPFDVEVSGKISNITTACRKESPGKRAALHVEERGPDWSPGA